MDRSSGAPSGPGDDATFFDKKWVFLGTSQLYLLRCINTAELKLYQSCFSQFCFRHKSSSTSDFQTKETGRTLPFVFVSWIFYPPFGLKNQQMSAHDSVIPESPRAVDARQDGTAGPADFLSKTGGVFLRKQKNAKNGTKKTYPQQMLLTETSNFQHSWEKMSFEASGPHQPACPEKQQAQKNVGFDLIPVDWAGKPIRCQARDYIYKLWNDISRFEPKMPACESFYFPFLKYRTHSCFFT